MQTKVIAVAADWGRRADDAGNVLNAEVTRTFLHPDGTQIKTTETLTLEQTLAAMREVFPESNS